MIIIAWKKKKRKKIELDNFMRCDTQLLIELFFTKKKKKLK